MAPSAPGRGSLRGRGKLPSRGGRAAGPSDKQTNNGDTFDQASLPKNIPSTKSRGGGAARGRGRGRGGTKGQRDKEPDGSVTSSSSDVAPVLTRPATRKSNQDQHPGEHHHRYTTKRRTKEQIQQDNLENATKLLAERKKSIQAHQSQIQSAAAFETAYRADKKVSETAVIRPDLVEIEQYAETMAAMTAAHEGEYTTA